MHPQVMLNDWKCFPIEEKNNSTSVMTLSSFSAIATGAYGQMNLDLAEMDGPLRKKSLCEVNMATYKVAQQTTRDRSCLIRHCAGWVFSHTLSHDPPRPLGVTQWHPCSQFISFEFHYL
ncbi:hypothetical protein An03g06175 [Aspergillus niger]|uniref:Uncharacterized protein n=2 Tax=Aspergillus niger TaxID=5061 RepID=A2QHA4_ASPNC|nr:hypothetical protein An03g06175 [Aspergillus niger]CAK38374.1 hypothetical protein An03g06175 [Aspergillus niger]